ncbi:MAG: Gx transporter family protein [Spirochaetes bacterium]|nr:Gx transporter family protein [Spirochaetota bacterium]
MKEKQSKNIAFFAGLSAFIAVFESLILPFPFFRLGISNIPICICFDLFNFWECLFVVLFKVFFSHLFRGTFFSYPFIIALAGNLTFLVIGFSFYKLFRKFTSFVSLSIIGAFSHNLGQIMVASLFIPSKALYFLAVILIFIGIILGFINGVFCNIIYNKFIMRLKL